MDEAVVLDVSREALFVLFQVSAPLLLVGMLVGVAIGLIQALTTVQEMTLSFVPKMLAMLLAMVLLLPFMLSTLAEFTRSLFDQMIAGG